MATPKKKEKDKDKMGAPTKYGPHILKAAREYIESKKDGWVAPIIELAPMHVDLEEAEDAQPRTTMGPVEYTINLPTIEELSLHLKITRATLYDWRKVHPDFSDIIDELMAKQGTSLLHNGVNGKSNSHITKLMLTKHGYVDKQVIDDKRSNLGDVFDAAAKRRKEMEAADE